MIDPRILEKIQKCLAMANDSRGDPNEAATALRMAQALMAKHGIDETGLEVAKIGRDSLKSPFSVSKMKDFELALMRGIARSFGCDVLWAANKSTREDYYARWVFIGQKSYLEVCVYTATVLQRQLVKARAAFVKRCVYDKTRNADGFCHGWVNAVLKNVQAFADPEGKLASALDAYKKLEMNIDPEKDKVKAQERQGTFSGFMAGQKEGQGVKLHRPMQQGEGPRLLA